jgi:hypothetical protein
VNYGSEQQRAFRRAMIADGCTMEAAAELAGISIGEAKLLVAEDARNPPPPDALLPITSPTAGQPKEAAMARTARKPKDDGGAIVAMDTAKARSLYLNDIKPAQSKVGEFMQEISTAFKAVKKACGIQPGAMKAAIKLVEMEDAKRDDWLRCFNGYLKESGIDPNPRDMVDLMGDDGYARPRPTLVTVPHDGDNSDLADAAEFIESSPQELAQQEGRPDRSDAEPDDATEEGQDD